MKSLFNHRGLSALLFFSVLLLPAVAHTQDRQVRAWGRNDVGQLGDGTTTNRNTPVQVSGLSGVIQVAGGNHSLALKSDGTVWAWGRNDHGELGDGTTTNRSTPVQVSGLTSVTQLVAGTYHSLALKSDGTVWAWGYNSHGQLGDGTTTNRSTPVQVSGLSGVIQVAGKVYHSLALKSDGTVWAWGRNIFGGLGDGTNTDRSTPVQVSGLTGVTQIAIGTFHSLALKSDGTVWAWGWNSDGQLGDGTNDDTNLPVQVSGLSGVTQVAGGGFHCLALLSDGTVWGWGRDRDSELGDGTNNDTNLPVQTSFPTGITQLAAGDVHSLALKSDGTMWACGSILPGILGNGTNNDSNIPVQVSGYTTVVRIAAAATHSLAIYRAPRSYVSNITLGYGQRGRLIARFVQRPSGVGIAGKTITFKIDGTTVGTATTADGGSGNYYAQINPYTISDSLSVGAHTITAEFAGDTNNPPSSDTATLTSVQTTTTLSAINAAGTVGDTILLRAKMSRSTSGTFGGQTVKFSIDGNYVGQAVADNTNGVAAYSYQITALGGGAHTLTATYDATDQYAGSTSNGTLTVSKANTSLWCGNAAGRRTNVVVLAARLKNPRSGDPIVGATITFKIEGTTLGTGTTDSTGLATFTYGIPFSLPLGAHTIAVEFAGDTSYNASTGEGALSVN